MHIEVRPARRFRDSERVRGVFAPMIEAISASGADLDRLRVVCDWIQYKASFRDAVMARAVLEEAVLGEAPAGSYEIAVDLRQCAAEGTEAFQAAMGAALAAAAGTPGGQADARPGEQADGRVWLEPWVAGRDSMVWRFNELYWLALADWEKTTGKEYEQSLPNGESDARNTAAAQELILELFQVWDELEARRALPEELYVLELGVGNGGQARTFLDEFAALDRRHGRGYYRRLHYLMGDYSARVLDRARQEIGHHREHTSGLVLEATRLPGSVGFLAGKAFLVYISNVYDNLPTDEVASIRGRNYLVEVRSYLSAADADALTARFGLPRDQLSALAARLLRIGPELLSESLPGQFPDTGQAVLFWQATWQALRLAERYVLLEGLDTYQLTPTVTGEVLRPLLSAEGDVRMHVSNGALASFADTLPLLHPFGRVVCHDLFTTSPGEYPSGFFGPGKYDGSVVNWVYGPLLQLLGSRRGFSVAFSPFKQRPASHVKTMTAQVRD
jgi:hypothetical protein